MIITLTGRPCEPPSPREKPSLSSALAGPGVKAAQAASVVAQIAPSARVSIVILSFCL
jgi:hypothetical protein